MEQTLGKRIAQNRKNLGLTQDQLAEKLGVTAQAVSKWENDQSCPDISILPQLAEIFSTSTDELLGREKKEAVKTVVIGHEDDDDDDEDEEDGVHIHRGGWEFKWDAGRRGHLTFAMLVLLVGVLTLLSKALEWDVGFWSILWPSTLLVYGFSRILRKFSFFNLGCALFGGYFLIDNLNIWEFEIGSELVFPIIVVLFGLSLLVDASRKPKKSRFQVFHNGKRVGSHGKDTKSTFTTDTHSFECSLSFGENTHYIDIPLLQRGDISCSFGELTVDLSGCEEVFSNCRIEASCSFGELELLVPKRFRVETDSSTTFAGMDIQGQPDPDAIGIIHLDASVSFGEIVVKYI